MLNSFYTCHRTFPRCSTLGSSPLLCVLKHKVLPFLNLRLRPPCFRPAQPASVKQTSTLQVLPESLKASFLLEVANKVLFPADQSSLQNETQQGLDISVFQGQAQLVNNIIVKCIKGI